MFVTDSLSCTFCSLTAAIWGHRHQDGKQVWTNQLMPAFYSQNKLLFHQCGSCFKKDTV